ncbi:hypothetical protein RB195_007620 [Necator americanus]|uniref:Uncharacterized protein n=1 Tax=Necator americanus TaxID=51031 RepID=A0ABR1C1W0_NECAM
MDIVAHQRRLADQKAWSEKFSTTAGFEPAIFCSVGRRVIHCATRPTVDGHHGTPAEIGRPKGGSEKFSTTAGFEPAIFCSVGRRVIHCATRPTVDGYRGTPTVIGRRKGEERKVLDHGRIRTCNLLLRRQTRYPLRHAAQCKNIEYACLTSTCHGTPAEIGRPKGVERKVLDHGRIRTCNLLLRRQTRYPLRHAA